MTYWGNDINCVVDDWGVLNNIKDNLEVALEATGTPAILWMPLESGIVCTCEKDGSFDVNCDTCNGTGWVGGYRRYVNLYEHFSASGHLVVETDGTTTVLGAPTFNPAEIQIKSNIIPNRYELVDGVLGGADITWPALTLPVDTFDFQIDVKEFIRDSDLGDSYVIPSVSIDAGPFFPLQSLVGQNLVAGTTIQIRVTLLRNSTDIRSPLLEIVRIRAKVQEIDYILMSKTRSPEDVAFDKLGETQREAGISYWTLIDFELLPKSLAQLLQSPYSGDRYQLFNFRRSYWQEETFRQLFDARKLSFEQEVYWRIF